MAIRITGEWCTEEIQNFEEKSRTRLSNAILKGEALELEQF